MSHEISSLGAVGQNLQMSGASLLNKTLSPIKSAIQNARSSREDRRAKRREERLRVSQEQDTTLQAEQASSVSEIVDSLLPKDTQTSSSDDWKIGTSVSDDLPTSTQSTIQIPEVSVKNTQIKESTTSTDRTVSENQHAQAFQKPEDLLQSMPVLSETQQQADSISKMAGQGTMSPLAEALKQQLTPQTSVAGEEPKNATQERLDRLNGALRKLSGIKNLKDNIKTALAVAIAPKEKRQQEMGYPLIHEQWKPECHKLQNRISAGVRQLKDMFPIIDTQDKIYISETAQKVGTMFGSKKLQKIIATSTEPSPLTQDATKLLKARRENRTKGDDLRQAFINREMRRLPGQQISLF